RARSESPRAMSTDFRAMQDGMTTAIGCVDRTTDIVQASVNAKRPNLPQWRPNDEAEKDARKENGMALRGWTRGCGMARDRGPAEGHQAPPGPVGRSAETAATASISMRKSGCISACTPTQVDAGGSTPAKNSATRGAMCAAASRSRPTMYTLSIVT